jgi:polysaccharide export outer membrane protein
MNRKLVILLCFVLVSCNTSKKVVYIQDVENGMTKKIIPYQGVVIKPKDIISIVVSSKNPGAAAVYNLPLVTYQAATAEMAYGYQQKMLGYLVDMEGYIVFPVLGKLKVSGFSLLQLSETIRQKLIQEDQLKEPVVTVEFMNFRISVLGAVSSPGTFYISNDQITLTEALGRAGDLTIYGKRDNITGQRNEGDEIVYYQVDLRSTDFVHSPVFYLQQNDVVIVSPNKTIAARSRINENKSLSVWVSVASFLTTVAVLLTR